MQIHVNTVVAGYDEKPVVQVREGNDHFTHVLPRIIGRGAVIWVRHAKLAACIRWYGSYEHFHPIVAAFAASP